MPLRLGCAVFAFALVSCHALPPAQQELPGETPMQLWQKAQQALEQGKAGEAITLYKRSLSADGQFTRNHLGLAAAYLEQGDETSACNHLGSYVSAHPTDLSTRSQYAELLLRQRRYLEARGQWELVVADAQAREGDWLKPLIEAHSRLVELAEVADDPYEEHLNRGIGFYLLAQRQQQLGDGLGGLTCEGLLCKAAGELSAAQDVRQSEAKPAWYLYRVWRQLGQHQPAQCALQSALRAAPFSHLSAAEHRSLLLAERVTAAPRPATQQRNRPQ